MKRLALFLLVGCSVAAVTSDDLDYSTADIQTAVSNVLSVGIQQVEGNDRIFESKFFRIPIGKKAEAVRKDDIERGMARVTIQGDRRPYVLEVVVGVEEKGAGAKWSSSGHDERLARQLADQIQEYLAKHKDKNLIDHFRAF